MSTNDVELLGGQIDNLARTIASERDATRKGNRVRNALLAVLAVMVVVNAWSIRQINAAKKDARVAACVRANEQIDQINGILTKFTTPPAGSTRTPEQQATIEARIRALEIPRRDCTPKGIAAFYSKEKAK